LAATATLAATARTRRIITTSRHTVVLRSTAARGHRDCHRNDERRANQVSLKRCASARASVHANARLPRTLLRDKPTVAIAIGALDQIFRRELAFIQILLVGARRDDPSIRSRLREVGDIEGGRRPTRVAVGSGVDDSFSRDRVREDHTGCEKDPR
jgi:hypothetical protein